MSTNHHHSPRAILARRAATAVFAGLLLSGTVLVPTPAGAVPPAEGDTDSDMLADQFETQVTHTDPSKRDTDGDRVSDGNEYIYQSSNPLSTDTDDDGLGDEQEYYQYKTNMTNDDTDDDGFTDGFEVRNGTDPLKNERAENPAPAPGPEQQQQRPDRDADGLFDDDETNVYGTNPDLPDTDGDGPNDGQEVFEGSNPNDPN